MEGPEPSRINEVRFVSPTELIIDRSNYWEGKKVLIHFIDKAKGIAVFIFGPTIYRKEGYQLLMVDASKANLFSTIVNYSNTGKQDEFEFDKIDFKKLTR